MCFCFSHRILPQLPQPIMFSAAHSSLNCDVTTCHQKNRLRHLAAPLFVSLSNKECFDRDVLLKAYLHAVL